MKINFLENLEADVRYPLGNRYFLKRYKYWDKGVWIDNKGKPINERVFSFIIEHGNKWDNSTTFNVVESELHTTMDKCNEHFNRIKAERKELLTAERKERKLYPQLHQFTFKNVVISVVSKMKYYGGYPGVGEKEVRVYANGLPYEYCSFTMDKDFDITYDWTIETIINSKVMRHNVNNETDWFNNGVFVKKVIHKKIKNSFVPLHFYIGYAVKLKDKIFNVIDTFDNSYRGYGFKDGNTEVNVSINELLNIEVVGELQGSHAWVSLLNKMKYAS